MSRLTAFLAAVAVMLGTDCAFAQNNVQRIQIVRGGFVSTGSTTQHPIYTLRNAKVQEELKLDEDQKTELTEAIRQMAKKRGEEYGKLRNVPAQQRAQKYREIAEQFKKESTQKVKEILEPKQLVRLAQIQLQLQGVRALWEPGVRKHLNITADQKSKFEEVQKATAVSRQKMYQDLRANGRIDPMKLREATQKLNEKNEKEIYAVLTQKQRDEFEKMKGRKFEMPPQRRTRLILPAVGAGRIRLRIQGGPGGKIQIRPVKPKAAKPEKKAEKKEVKKEEGDR